MKKTYCFTFYPSFLNSSYDDIFYTLDPKNGRVSAEGARNILMNTGWRVFWTYLELISGIPVPALRKIWELVDFTKSGRLDSEEFAVALLLTEIVKKGIFPLILSFLFI